MKKTFTLLFICFYFFAEADYWTQKANYGGSAITAGVGFSIALNGYIGLGVNNSIYYNDFWEYDPILNTWTQIASFQGIPRQGATAFSIGNKGYVGTGYDSLGNRVQDFWEYDPLLNQWISIPNFTGTPRDFASGFSINNKGYIGCGLSASGPEDDFWEYDPLLNTWTQKASPSYFNGNFAAVSFVINGKGYITTGYGSNSTQEYDPVINTWSTKTPCPVLNYATSGFAIGNRGYVGTGIIDQFFTTTKEFWQYDPVSDTWIQKTDFGGLERASAAGFSIGNKGYIGTGNSTAGIFNDFWEYTPDSTTNIEETPNNNLQFTISPNPVKEFIVISYPSNGKENIGITITDAQGKKVYQKPLTPKGETQVKVPLENLGTGIYFVEVSNDKQKMVKKFVKE